MTRRLPPLRAPNGRDRRGLLADLEHQWRLYRRAEPRWKELDRRRTRDIIAMLRDLDARARDRRRRGPRP